MKMEIPALRYSHALEHLFVVLNLNNFASWGVVPFSAATDKAKSYSVAQHNHCNLIDIILLFSVLASSPVYSEEILSDFY